jgi:hypothetical protein
MQHGIQGKVALERLVLLAALLFTPPDFFLGIFVATLKLRLNSEARLAALWQHGLLCLALLLKLLHCFYSAKSGYSPRAWQKRVRPSSLWAVPRNLPQLATLISGNAAERRHSMCRPIRAMTGVMALALLLPMPAQSRPLVDQYETHAYVPPITAEVLGGQPEGSGYGFGLSPAGGPCERAYQRALTRSHPSWWERYEDCVRQEVSR